MPHQIRPEATRYPLRTPFGRAIGSGPDTRVTRESIPSLARIKGTSVNTEMTYEDALRKSGDEIIHLVPASRIDNGSRIAYCGFDTTGRTFKPPVCANCVVCLEMSEDSKQDKEKWLRERDEWLDSLH